MTLTLLSPPNGSILTSVCDAGRHSRSPTESTTAAIAATASTSSAPARPSPFLISASSRRSVWTMDVTRNLRTGHLEVAE